MAFQLDRRFQYDPYDRLGDDAWAPQGFNIGSDEEGMSTLDGAVRISNGSSAYFLAYGFNAGYVPLYFDAASYTFSVSGTAELELNGTSLNPYADGGLNVGTQAKRVGTTYTYSILADTDIWVGRDATTGGTIQRGYLVLTRASDTSATRTGFIEFRGQNGTRYGYIGNGLARVTLAFENNGYLDVTMGSNVNLPMMRLTRSDTSTNHIEMLSSNTTGAKGHIGTYAHGLYVTEGSYYNGTSWILDNAGYAPARIILDSANADSCIKFYTAASNTADPTHQITLTKDGHLQLVGNGYIANYIAGSIKSYFSVVYSAQLNHTDTASIPGSSQGMLIFKIQQTSVSPYYNTALVLTGHDQYNGSTPVILGQTITGAAHQLYIGGATGLRYNNGAGGASPTLYNGSGQNLQITVLAWNVIY